MVMPLRKEVAEFVVVSVIFIQAVNKKTGIQ
jgi:hypothetical protein